MDFVEYLSQKKIDAEAFRSAEPVRYTEWEQLFSAIHPDSFTAQKKFYLNSTRRTYHLENKSGS